MSSRGGLLATVVLLATSLRPSICQVVSIGTGENPMDNTKWVRMHVNADKNYKSSNGTEITPSLDIQCNASPKYSSMDVYIYTGVVEAASDGNVRVKVDDKDPFYITYSILPDGATLQYIAPSNLFSRMSPFEFAAMLIASKTVFVEFSPAMSPNTQIAKFNTSSLLDEFKKHQECFTQYLPK